MWENLKSTVNNVIRPNDNREITGEKHNNTLSAVINSLGKYSQFAGLAFKNTNPGVPDGPVFYFAAFKGVYINFNRIEVEENEVAILNYNNNKWEKIVIGYSPIAPATIEDIRLTTLIDSINESNAFKTNFEFKQDAIADIQMPFLHATVSHIDADGQLIKGVPTSEVLIPVPLAEASTDADTPGKHGFMSYQDKDLLYSIPNYTISGKKISENPILTYGDIQGVAYLGEDGKIPSSLLPSYVDDVLEYDSIDNFPLIGEGGKIYLDKKTNLAYRWSGTVYVSISSSIALGETSSTAYAGDKGKKNADDIADLKANKADKTSVYTKDEVDYLIEHFKLPDHIKAITFSVDGILVSKNEDGNLVIGGNVIVEGGISMYGPGQFGDTIMDYIVVDGTSIKIIDGKLTVDPDFVGGGTVKGIKVNGHTYDEVDTNGYVTIPDYPTELAWNSITGKPSTFMPSAHTHKIEDITDIADASVSHATTADRLKKEIMIWGQPFDGSTDVEGAISNVDVINIANADTVISLYIKDGVLFIDGDLAVTGGITMYASDGVKSGMIDQVYAVLDQSLFSKSDDGTYITITGEIGGGTVKAVKVGSTQYDPDTNGIISLPDYPTTTTLEWDNILNKPSSFPPSSHTHAIGDITNLSSASVSYASSAGNSDTLDGNHASAFAVASHTHNYLSVVYSENKAWSTIECVTDPLKFKVYEVYNDGGPSTYGEVLSVTGILNHWQAQLWMGSGKGGRLYYRNKEYNDNTWGDWRTVAFTSDNVASANYASSAGNADTLDGNHASAFALSGHTHSYLPLSGGTLTNNLTVQTGGIWVQGGSAAGGDNTRMGLTSGMPSEFAYNTSRRGVRLYSNAIAFADPYNGNSNNDSGWIRHLETTANSGILEIATGDDGSESIVARQYNTSSAIVREAYLLNSSGNTSFPGTVSAPTFSGTATYASSAGNADTVDGYHASGLLRSDGGNWNPSANIILNASANSQEWSFDIYRNGYSGCYWHVWDSSLGSMLKVNADNGKVYAPYNFVGTLEGVATSCLPLSGGTMTGSITMSNGTHIRVNNGANPQTSSYISAGGGYTPNSGLYGINILSCDTDSVQSGLGQDLSPSTAGFDMSVATCYSSNRYAELSFVVHGKDSTTYYDMGKFTFNNNAIQFRVYGNILANGGITMYSDLRKKNVISDEVLSVKEIAAAPLFAHTYKSDENHYLHIGTSAQYWSAIHEGWFTRKDSEGYYQMELQNLGVAMGISLAREIVTFEGTFKKYESKTDKKIRLMRKKINDLEAANKALDARIKELEGSREERRTA